MTARATRKSQKIAWKDSDGLRAAELDVLSANLIQYLHVLTIVERNDEGTEVFNIQNTEELCQERKESTFCCCIIDVVGCAGK